MKSPTTRRHRALAFACVWTDAPRKLELQWIEDGSNEDAAGQRAVRTAQALADIEAEALARKGATPHDP
jgi:hypothetical protein